MGSDRIRTEGNKSSSLIPKSKPKKFSFLQPRYQDQVETDAVQENQQQDHPTPPLTHSFGRMSVFPIQAKLTIGQPNDKYEQEADRVASQVVQQINVPSSVQSTQGQSVQRMEEPEEEELQTKPMISSIQRSHFRQQLSQDPASEMLRSNQTGLPDHLKTGIENLSGYSIDNVRVHYNSDKPSQLQAHAYAQGTDIHIAPGQEKHLPHEGWHVVQQMQGRVKPTMQAQGVAINDDSALEREADEMGRKADRGSLVKNFSQESKDQKQAKGKPRYVYWTKEGTGGQDGLQGNREKEKGREDESATTATATKGIAQQVTKVLQRTEKQESPEGLEESKEGEMTMEEIKFNLAYVVSAAREQCGENEIEMKKQRMIENLEELYGIEESEDSLEKRISDEEITRDELEIIARETLGIPYKEWPIYLKLSVGKLNKLSNQKADSDQRGKINDWGSKGRESLKMEVLNGKLVPNQKSNTNEGDKQFMIAKSSEELRGVPKPLSGGKTHHSTLFGRDKKVDMAGHISLDDEGKISEIDHNSGHFKPSGQHLLKFVQDLSKLGVIKRETVIKVRLEDGRTTFERQGENIRTKNATYKMTKSNGITAEQIEKMNKTDLEIFFPSK